MIHIFIIMNEEARQHISLTAAIRVITYQRFTACIYARKGNYNE